MKAARNRLIDLLEEHGESFLECKGCSLCSEIKKLRKYIDRDPADKFQHILAKGQDMTKSEIAFLKENDVTIETIGKALGMSKSTVTKLLDNFGLVKRRENDEMAKLALEEYQDYKAKGLTDKDIATKKGMNPQYISQLKKKWFNETEKPKLAIVEPVESKPTRQDKESEYAALINELSDKVKQQEGMIEKLQAKVEEYENLNAACADVEEETANLRKEVDYLSEKRLDEKEEYLNTLEKLKETDYELQNHKKWLLTAGDEINTVKKENQHLWGLLKLKAAELNA